MAQSQSGSKSIKGQNVTVLLPGDVTIGETPDEVFIPDAKGRAALRKREKPRQFITGIEFSSTMTEEDVEKILCEKFPFLRNKRFCCASAHGNGTKLDKDNQTNLNKDSQTKLNKDNQANLNKDNQTDLNKDNRTKLNFHGEPRIWHGNEVKKYLNGNRSLYVFVEGTPESIRDSGESQQPTHGPANQEMIPPAGGVSLAFTRPLNSSEILVPNPTSHQNRASEKRKLDNKTAHQTGLLLQSQTHQASAKQKKLNSVAEQPAADYGYYFQPVSQHMPQHKISSTSAIVPPQEHLATSVVHNTGIQVYSASSQQSLSQAIIVMTPIAQQRDLSMRTSMAAQGSLPQYCPPAVVNMVEHKTDCSKPVQCWQLAKQEQDRTVSVESSSQKFLPESQSNVFLQTPADPENDEQAQIANFAEGFKSAEKADKVGRDASNWTDIETPSKTINMSEEEFDSALEDAKDVMLEDIDWFQDDCQSQKEVSMSTDVHQKELTAQTSEQQVEAISNTKTVDSGVESTGEDHTSVDHDNGQSQDLIQLHDSWAYTKTRKKILIVLRDPLPKDVISHDANFQDFGNVNLDKINPYNLSCLAPESQNPGVKQVKLVLTFANGSCEVGSTKFTYIDQENEAVEVLLKNKEMWPDLFIKCGEQMKNEHIGSQTSDHSGVTEAGSSSLSENTNAWSVKVLKDLVYKAAQVGGLEFIKTIFTTSAGKVVFSNYKDSATLPEDVARANGHTTLADYLQDLNNRLAKEGSSDTGTETIDWLELKRAVDTEQGLPCTDDAQTLKNWPPPSPESDYDGSDYLADNEMSVCSSPSRGEVSDTEDEDHSQNTIIYRSFKKVNEEDLPVENDDSSLFPLHLVGNQLGVIPSIKAENAAYEHKQLNSGEVESHSSEDDMNKKEYECASFKTDQNGLNQIAVPCDNEVGNWDSLGSEEISTVKETSTGTTSSHAAAQLNISSHQETNHVEVPNGSETGLDGEQKEFKKIDNDETTRSRGNSDEEALDEIKATTSDLEGLRKLREPRRNGIAEKTFLMKLLKSSQATWKVYENSGRDGIAKKNFLMEVKPSKAT